LRIAHPLGAGTVSTPAYVTTAAQAVLHSVSLERPSVSFAAWSTSGRYVAVENSGDLAILQFDAPSAPLHPLARTGDPELAYEPAWSPTGDFLVYTSTSVAIAPGGGLASASLGNTHLYRVPVDVATSSYGGAATPVQGASDTSYAAFHPTVSADGQLIAFVRVDASVDPNPHYGDPAGEIWVVPSGGGMPVPLVQHDDPAIADVYMGKLTNSWPRFTQKTGQDANAAYYAFGFTSRRGPGILDGTGGSPFQRMFVSFLRRDAGGNITVYAPVLVPGQDFGAQDLTLDVTALSFQSPPPLM
jgi:hypothetical protein